MQIGEDFRFGLDSCVIWLRQYLIIACKTLPQPLESIGLSNSLDAILRYVHYIQDILPINARSRKIREL